MAEKRLDSRPISQVVEDIAKHYEEKPAFGSEQEIIDRFLNAFTQDPMTGASPSDAEVDAEDTSDASENSED
jgi:hypothetical protein